ncbi:hypothetical protein TRFO_28539 [Tritrichomonas foetus]|uniref:Uncharacterized protein n=1 Tax=Tritrichomonas foetus TaxID=1144522 RepID=A0A1J4JZC2_9EUKA|nr:hypothetical protein TRFO_28539 [Tritrichomonas foetus]|eukprot:OHT04042.1 hypothetical protein TRFO_28539 [Tritrichomonas foetus]
MDYKNESPAIDQKSAMQTHLKESRDQDKLEEVVNDEDFAQAFPPSKQFQTDYMAFLIKCMQLHVSQLENYPAWIHTVALKPILKLFYKVRKDFNATVCFGCDVSEDQLEFLIYYLWFVKNFSSFIKRNKLYIKFLGVFIRIIDEHHETSYKFLQTKNLGNLFSIYSNPFLGWEQSLLSSFLSCSENAVSILIKNGFLNKIFEISTNSLNSFFQLSQSNQQQQFFEQQQNINGQNYQQSPKNNLEILQKEMNQNVSQQEGIDDIDDIDEEEDENEEDEEEYDYGEDEEIDKVSQSFNYCSIALTTLAMFAQQPQIDRASASNIFCYSLNLCTPQIFQKSQSIFSAALMCISASIPHVDQNALPQVFPILVNIYPLLNHCDNRVRKYFIQILHGISAYQIQMNSNLNFDLVFLKNVIVQGLEIYFPIDSDEMITFLRFIKNLLISQKEIFSFLVEINFLDKICYFLTEMPKHKTKIALALIFAAITENSYLSSSLSFLCENHVIILLSEIILSGINEEDCFLMLNGLINLINYVKYDRDDKFSILLFQDFQIDEVDYLLNTFESKNEEICRALEFLKVEVSNLVSIDN